MRVRALVLFISAVAAQHTTSQNLNRDTALSENLNSPELGLSRLRLSPVVRRREAGESEAGRLCVFLREREADGPMSCKHQLNLRSKFNYNPFGLRFGKRAGETRRRTRPPVLLLLREPQAS